MQGPNMRSRKRKKKKKGSPLFMFIMFIILIGLAAWVFAAPVIERWLPSREYKDLNEWFEVSGDEVRIYLDNSTESEYKACAYGGEVYFPYEYVKMYLNDRFYLDENEGLITYTLPLEVKDYSPDTVTDGHEAFIRMDGDFYLSAGLISEYTDITFNKFISGDETAKRVFIYRGGQSLNRAFIKRKTALRTSGDKKSPILTELAKGEEITVTDRRPSWSRVVTGSGFIGYADTSCISEEGSADDLVLMNTYEEPEVPYVLMDEQVVLGFQAVYSEVPDFDRYYSNTDGTVNAVTPQFLQIDDADGSIADMTSREYIEAAHAAGVKVWPSVDNVNRDGGIYDFDTGEFFSSALKRRSFISKIMNLALDYGYDGINLDFEGISADAGESFTQFFRELSVECHKNSLTLSIDNYVPYSYNSHYNLKEQGVFADYVIIMCYDEHTGSDIGPVASVGYTEYGISEALKSVEATHVIAALPFYTRVWRTNDGIVSSEAMGMKEASQYVSDNAIILKWDDAAGAYYGETAIGSGLIQIWMEDETSLSAKTALIKEYGIGGLAVWRLGFEPAGIWSVLKLN